MKKISIIMVLILLLVQVISVSALSAEDAKDDWQDLKKVSVDAQEVHRDAKVDWAANKSDENNQAVVDTGKEVLHAALNEVEAWLMWKDAEASDNDDVPAEIKDSISADVEANLAKIEGLRADVDGVDNRLELGLVFLNMIGKYFELLADVARNSGDMWVYIGEVKAETIADYEAKLRESTSDSEVLVKLDLALSELEIAERNLENAKDTYAMVKLPGTPLLKFGEGNNYLNAARNNLIVAHGHLNAAYLLMATGGQ